METRGEADPDKRARKPAEIRLVDDLERFGVTALFGRPLTINEIRTIRITENIRNAYIDRESANDITEWITNNAELHEILSEARKDAENIYGRTTD